MLTAPTLPDDAKAILRGRCAVALRGMQREARMRAEQDYVTGELGISKKKAVTGTKGERKKRMRNKSAYISRQTQRHYEKLLAKFVQRSESERDGAFQSCVSYAHDIESLRATVAAIEQRIQGSRCAQEAASQNSQEANIAASTTKVPQGAVYIAPTEFPIFETQVVGMEDAVKLTGSSQVELMSHILDDAISFDGADTSSPVSDYWSE